MKADNTFAVAIFGVPEFERELVERIFSLSESRAYVYRTVDESENHTADIALVDAGNANAADEFQRFNATHGDCPSVIIADGSDPSTDYRVKRPFTAMRMLGALDRLVEERLSGGPRPAKPAASSVSRTVTSDTAAPSASVTVGVPPATASALVTISPSDDA